MEFRLGDIVKVKEGVVRNGMPHVRAGEKVVIIGIPDEMHRDYTIQPVKGGPTLRIKGSEIERASF